MTSEKIAIYVGIYLPPSETFIHKQILASDHFERWVLTSHVQNLPAFPFPRIHQRPPAPQNRVVRMIRKGARRLRKLLSLRDPATSLWSQHLAEENYRFVHCHFGSNAIDLLPSLKASRTPLVVTYHGFDASAALKSSGYQRQLREAFSYAHLNLCVCRLFHDRLIDLGCPPSKTRVHHIGVPVNDLPWPRKFEEKPVRILQVGRLVEKKGQALLLAAMVPVVARHPEVTLTLVGDGPERPRIEALVKALKLTKNVSLLGYLPHNEVYQALATHHIFVHHAVTGVNGDQEGIPIGILEAMGSGLPVVSTIHSGIPEVIRHGENGLLTQEGDWEGLVTEILKLIEVPGLAATLARSARRTVEESFNQETQNRVLAGIYDEFFPAHSSIQEGVV